MVGNGYNLFPAGYSESLTHQLVAGVGGPTRRGRMRRRVKRAVKAVRKAARGVRKAKRVVKRLVKGSRAAKIHMAKLRKLAMKARRA